MGGRVQKIAFIIFALLFVAIMAVLNTSVLNMATSANKTLTTTVTTSDSSSLNVYDNTSVYGSTVQDCAKKPDGIISSALYVFVRTAGSGDYTCYMTGSEYNNNNAGDSDYINPNSMFHSNLITNSNGVTCGLLFYQDSITGDAVPDPTDLSSAISEANPDGGTVDTTQWVIVGADEDAGEGGAG